MRVITKQELLHMIDQSLPDDAQISATSSVAGDAFEINQELIAELIPDLKVVERCGGAEETLPGATHVLFIP